MAQTVPWRRVLVEFLVISVGVFVGLVADEWRRSIADRGLERVVLVDVLEDLAVDSADLQGVLEGSRERDEAGLWVSRHAGMLISVDSAVSMIAPLLSRISYTPPRATYVGLRDSGGLSVIADPILRQELIEYFELRQPNFRELYEGSRDYYRDLQRSGDLFTRVIPAPDATSLIPTSGPPVFDLLGEWEVISSDAELVNRFVWLGLIHAIIARRVLELQDANHALRESIRAYLS